MTDKTNNTRIGSDNQGEGNRDAANAYNEDTKKFIADGKVKQAAEDAKFAFDGPEAEELKKAEREGKRAARS